MPPVEISGICAARRAVLLGAGVAGLAVATGCGGSAGPTQSGNVSANGSPSPQAGQPGTSGVAKNTVNAPTEDPFGGFPSDDGPPYGAIIETKEVPVGAGVLVRDSKIVVQPKAGTFKAFSATCPHQGVTVQPPAKGAAIMECPGHNSQFKASDGSLVRGPASRGLAAIPVKVVKGYVVEV